MPRNLLRNSTALAVGLGIALPQLAAAAPMAQADTASIARSGAASALQEGMFRLAQADAATTAEDPVVIPEGAAAAPEAPAAEAVVTEPEAKAMPEAEAAEPQAKAAEAAEKAAAAAAEAAAAATDDAAPVAAAEPAEAPVVEAAPEPAPPVEPVATTDAVTETPAEATGEAAEAAAAETAPQAPDSAAAEARESVAADAAAEVEKPRAEEPGQAAANDAAANDAAAPSADAPVVSDAPGEAELADALAERGNDAAKPAKTDKPAPAPKAANDAAAPVVAPADAGDAPGEAELADALAKRADAAAEPAKADAAAPVARADGKTVAPVTGTAPADAPAAVGAVAGTDAAAPADDADLAAALDAARAVPEAEARPTDAAREAAAAAVVPAAAALAESAAPVTTTETREVTKETSRSATEDFATDVRGTDAGGQAQGSATPVVVGADGQPVTEADARTEAARDDDKDDDRSNLEKALRQGVLPALAGLAVGQLLSNDRQVALNTGDRVVVTRPDGSQEIIKDDNVLLLRPGSTVQTEEYADGSTRTIVTREDGSRVVTIRDAELRVLRRSLVQPDGTTTALIDETAAVTPVDVGALPPPARPIEVAPGQQLSEDALREALRRETQVDRSFTLGQVRNIPEVRALVAPVDIQAITFDTGSAAINPDQAKALSTLGRVIADSVKRNPSEIYLIEGHTDTVGADAMNLALSDRRAESVALALTEFFNVPPENMVVQGYGEQFLKVAQEGDIRTNRRVAVRRITDLLARN